MSQPLLSDRQRSTVAAAVTLLGAVVIVGGVGGLLLLVALFLRAFSPVLMPLAVGGVAALVFHPYYQWLRERLRLPRVAALVGVFASLLLPVVAFAWFFGALVVEQVSGLVSRVPEWWEKARTFVDARWPQVVSFLESNPWGQRLREAFVAQQGSLVEGLQGMGGRALSAGAGALRWVAALLGWAVLPVYFAFFLMADARKLADVEQLLPFLKSETRKDVVYLVQEFVSIVVAFFRGQLLVAFFQGLLFAAGFSLVGLSYGFLLGLVLGFLNVIPYLGSVVGLAVALPLAFFQSGGGLATALWVLGVFALVQAIEGYLLTPRIMGERTGLHPLAIIVAVFFWGTALGGILGMILAIPLTAFLVVLWRLAREKYIGELV